MINCFVPVLQSLFGIIANICFVPVLQNDGNLAISTCCYNSEEGTNYWKIKLSCTLAAHARLWPMQLNK
jgi:hypothetical protein